MTGLEGCFEMSSSSLKVERKLFKRSDEFRGCGSTIHRAARHRYQVFTKPKSCLPPLIERKRMKE